MRDLLGDLESDGALARDGPWVVVGRHHERPGPGRHLGAGISRSAAVGPQLTTVAPARSTAVRFTGEALTGMTTCAGMPRSAAAVASASA